MPLEVVKSETQYEAFLHHVGTKGILEEEYHTIRKPEIDAVRGVKLGQWAIETLAWIELSERARVLVKHTDNPLLGRWSEDHPVPYNVWDYPDEELLGTRMLHKEVYFVTEYSHTSVDFEFTTLSEVIERQSLSPYMLGWLSTIAARNYRPAFFSKIDNLLTGETESSYTRHMRTINEAAARNQSEA